jgi:hypothetical protein
MGNNPSEKVRESMPILERNTLLGRDQKIKDFFQGAFGNGDLKDEDDRI